MTEDAAVVAGAQRLLLVEDSPADAELVRAQLRRSEFQGVEVIEARSLRAAREALAGARADCVLLDLGLPDATGLEALVGLLEQDPPPVVVLTGNADERAAVAAVAAGAQDYLVKGAFDPEVLGKTIRYAIERDRTLRRLRDLEAELVAERNRLATAQRIALLGSWMIAAGSAHVQVSPEAAAILDLVPGAVELEGAFELFHPEDRTELASALASAGRGHPETRVVRLATAEDPRWVQFRTDGVDRGTGDLIGTVQEVTEREQSALERVRLLDRLEHAQRLESLGRLAGGIAHNFNNLLAAMLMQTELLCDGLDEDSPAQSGLAELMATIVRATGLTRELLVFGRARDAEVEVFDVNQLLVEVRSLLGQTLGEEIDVRLELCEESGSVSADRNQIEQAVVNLAINGRDAMDHAGALVIRTTRSDPGWIEIAVADSGSGMTPEVMARALEPFYSTKPVDRGTGLGLSIVHGTVTQAGGDLDIESQLHEGTTVTMRFPTATSTAEPSMSPSAQGTTVLGETVLVVDDQPTIVRLIDALLSRAGYRVESATSGAAALEMVSSGLQADVVLTDLVMPQMSGTDLAAALRERLPDIAVVFMSGYSDGQLLDDGHDRDVASTFLGKPFTAQALFDAVRRSLCDDVDGPPPVAD